MDRVSLIYKVLSDQASNTEKEELDEWVIKSQANREEFEDIKLLWESSGMRERSSDDDLGFEKIKLRVKQRLVTKRRIRQAILLIVLAIIALTIVFILKNTRAKSDAVQFSDTAMMEVIKTLEEQYNIKIDVDDSELLKCEFSGTFYKVDRQAVLESIERSLNIEGCRFARRSIQSKGR